MSTDNSNYPINLNDNPDYPEQEYILVASPRTPFTDPSSELPPIVRLGRRRRRRIVYPELRGLHPVRRQKPVLYYQRSRPLRSRPRIVEDIVPYGLPIDVVPPQIDEAAEAVGEDTEEEERLKFRSQRSFTYTLPRRRGRLRSIRNPPKSHPRSQSSQRLIDDH